MRFDLRILWVEDAGDFYSTARELLEMHAEDVGIKLSFEYIQDIPTFVSNLKKDTQGFRLFDMCYIDYNLSPDGYGSDLILNLRKESVSADILFYSSEYEKDIRETITNDLSSYEGVYIANRGNFEEKACKLIDKNARRLTSLANIRGFLMDQTSENDFTMQSYIVRRYSELTDEQRKDISSLVSERIKHEYDRVIADATKQMQKLNDNGITNIGKTLKLMSALVPLDLKYQIFQKMVEFIGKDDFTAVTIDEYLSEIVKARNTLAHKKLDVCREHRFIKYADTMQQFIDRECPSECKDHVDDYKYSVDKWNAIRKKAITFGDEIDAVQRRLLSDMEASHIE